MLADPGQKPGPQAPVDCSTFPVQTGSMEISLPRGLYIEKVCPLNTLIALHKPNRISQFTNKSSSKKGDRSSRRILSVQPVD
jgi:hypothetical protein